MIARISPFGKSVFAAAATGLAAALLAPAALAQGTLQQQACAPDAFRLCGAAIPNIERIKTCLGEHIADLSPTCREVYKRGLRSELQGQTDPAPHQRKGTD